LEIAEGNRLPQLSFDTDRVDDETWVDQEKDVLLRNMNSSK